MDRKTRNRGGRPSKGPRDSFTVRTEKGIKSRLEVVAKSRGVFVSDLAAEFIEKGLVEAEQHEGLPQQDVFDLNLKTG